MAALRITPGYRRARRVSPGSKPGGASFMQSPLVPSHRKPRRVPGLWVSIALALAVHAGMGLALFLDARRPHDTQPGPQLATATPAERIDPTTRMGAPRSPSAPPQGSTDAGPAADPARVEPRPGARRLPRAPAEETLRPSFDCQLAQSLTEDLICSDPELARLDRELARLYARAKFATRDPVGFREQTHDEWRRREETCSDRDCLRDWYAQRRKQLNEVIAQSGR